MAAKNKLSPVMQQYMDMKAENPEALLLFRLGDFYEAFFDDAKTISEALSLVLTKRGTDETGANIPMCGIPWHAADNYFGRLVKSGFKVALVEQMETPAQAAARGHKFIERKIVRVLTPGTLTDENLLNPKSANFLVAIVPMQNGGFDVAGCDISTGEFFVGTTNDLIDDLVRLNPAEVIFPSSHAENDTVFHMRTIFKTTPVFEKLYIRSDISQIVENVFGGVIGDIKTDPADSAICLLAGYLFNAGRGVTTNFRAPRQFKIDAQLLIDSATWKSLEIDAPINAGGACLIDVLDKTKTAAGARKLRAYMRALSGSIDEIKLRQKHINHFISNRNTLINVAHELSSMPDVGRSLARLSAGRGTPRDISHVRDFIINLPNLKMMSQALDDDFAKKLYEIKTHDELGLQLNRALNDELPTFFRDGNVIRDGFDLSLDKMRELSHGARNTIAGLQSQYIEQTGIHTLKIKFNNILGYFIEVPATRADDMMKPESGFIHRQTLAGNVRFTTSQLIELDNDIRNASDKAAAIEEEIINKFILQIGDVADDLLATADLLADLDVWSALAFVAIEYDWACPEMTTGPDFCIVGGRHPVIEAVLRKHGDNFVKNDCDLSNKKIALITGPNMAGKSTYLRQNALIVVLAHLGSFVPAKSATIGICDQLFSRVGASDNLAAGQSTFMVEMSETANILRRATNRSFIIFDEIGRGTATYDGMAIAQSVLEFLNNMSPRTLFATHYHELTALSGDNGGVLNMVSCLTIDVREYNNEIIFMHKIVNGVANRSYGIHVAKMAGMPESVVARAESVLNELEHGGNTTVKNEIKIEKAKSAPKHKNESNSPQLNLFGE